MEKSDISNWKLIHSKVKNSDKIQESELEIFRDYLKWKNRQECKSSQNSIALTNQNIFDKSDISNWKLIHSKVKNLEKIQESELEIFRDYLKWKNRQNWIALTNQNIFDNSDISNWKLIHSKVKNSEKIQESELEIFRDYLKWKSSQNWIALTNKYSLNFWYFSWYQIRLSKVFKFLSNPLA